MPYSDKTQVLMSHSENGPRYPEGLERVVAKDIYDKIH
jgi:hypothetical protein